MKCSELWLREWVDPPINIKVLSHQMTMAGLTIDKTYLASRVFFGVKIGKIIECYKLIGSEELKVVKVNIGSNRILNTVCKLSNCRVNLKVAVATIGSVLPSSLKVNTMKIHNILSECILCSFMELDISNDCDNLIELPKDAPVGADCYEYLKLYDNIIEMTITPNRSDCLSIIGIARDISVLNNIRLTNPIIKKHIPTINSVLPIYITETQACPCYLGRIIKNICIKTISPLWISEKLRRCGINSINSVIDITNYVLLELGQPIHVFDLHCIKGGIVVRMAIEGEIFILSDGKKIELNTDTLVIADQYKILAIGGIINSYYPSIHNKTKDIFIESAFFNPSYIIGRARRQGLQTHASYRYERGVDFMLQNKAMERVTDLLIKICGGQVGPIINITTQNTLPKNNIILLRRKKLNSLLGYVISTKIVKDILCRLGFSVIKKNNDWLVQSPSWRFDIHIEEDLIEEIARIYGYDKIPNIPLCTNLIITKNSETNLELERVKTLLVDHGFHEVITYSFVDPKIQTLLHPNQEALTILNPISIDMSVMRLSLWSGLLSTVIYNQNRQKTRLRLFESGLCFFPDEKSNLNVQQEIMLAGIITGDIYDLHWDLKKRLVDFYDLKGEVESILELTGRLVDVNFRKEVHPALHPGKNAGIYLCNERIGLIGVIHPELEHKLNLHSCTLVFELEWNKISHRIIPQSRAISRFPENNRTISIVVAENVSAEDIVLVCKKVNVQHIINVNLFDVYRGKNIPKGYKSLAINLVLQDINRTLKEKEINTIIEKCINILKKQFQVYIRN
ncbi:Phenylalanine--tRNA ligase beta subunit [Candidatus Ecksteinia adelgidicola]|nr:Phenylalanine--tRNA ligase beta subunit [Candidatus Ecksteinia adelgidicola]